MKRIDCLRILAERVTNELVVMTMTGANWEWRHLSDHEGSMNLSAMGNGTAVGAGMAFGLPHRRVVVLESDGSTLLEMSSLTTLGMYKPANLAVFVFDNEVYSGSGISEPTATAYGASLEAIAKGAGVDAAVTVSDLAGFREVASDVFDGWQLSYVVAKVEDDPSARQLPKPTIDHLENKYRFMRYVERTEGRRILPSVG